MRLEPRPLDHATHLPVDCFFESLAKEQGRLSVGVILSGTGSDGSVRRILFCRRYKSRWSSPESARTLTLPPRLGKRLRSCCPMESWNCERCFRSSTAKACGSPWHNRSIKSASASKSLSGFIYALYVIPWMTQRSRVVHFIRGSFSLRVLVTSLRCPSWQLRREHSDGSIGRTTRFLVCLDARGAA